MKCIEKCQGTLKRVKLVYKYKSKGYLYTISKVPMWRCDCCKDILFDDETVFGIKHNPVKRKKI